MALVGRPPAATNADSDDAADDHSACAADTDVIYVAEY